MKDRNTEIILWDTVFEHVKDENALVQLGLPKNRILVSDLKIENGLVIVPFDLFEKNLPTHRIPMSTKTVIFLEDVLKNSYEENMSNLEKYNKWSHEEGWNSAVVSIELSLRIKEDRPFMIRIGENVYDLLENGSMKSLKQGVPDIQSRDWILNRAKDTRHMYFDTVENRPVALDLSMTRLPKNIVKIEIGNFAQVDPVGLARIRKDGDGFYVIKHPVKPMITAKLTPLKDTFLAHIAKGNLERKKIEPEGKQLLIGPSGKLIEEKTKKKGTKL